ncbi:hypothetical protein [Roseisalinus antarcticus]|nr:hypothetical protein [Roseisalinus antarcticus]
MELAAILCSLILGGEVEQRHYFDVVDRRHHIRVDCETDSHVVEVGFDDKRSSNDSLHQALFSANLTGKLPMIVIIDTNGFEENVQYQIETVARMTGVSYMTVTEDFLIRWQMTEPFRQNRSTLFRQVETAAVN